MVSAAAGGMAAVSGYSEDSLVADWKGGGEGGDIQSADILVPVQWSLIVQGW